MTPIINYGHDWRDSTKKLGRESGSYKYTFSVPEAWGNKSVNIIFEGSMTDTKVTINGKQAGPVHQGAFYRFTYDISKLLKYGQDNLLEVTVHKRSSNESVNKAEREADYWIFGGIFRPVYLEAKPTRHIKRVAIDAKANGSFSANIFTEGARKGASVSGQIKTLDGEKVGAEFETDIDKGSSIQTLSTTQADPKVWSPEFPNLYEVTFQLKDSDGEVIHRSTQRFGFRTVELREGDGLYVNDQKVRFRGVDYHDFWPGSGRTTSKALSIKDVNLMKDMNMNAVRMSHYPHDTHFYEVADSLGLFVLDELAGWQDAYDTPIGRTLVKEMGTTDVNHPSIVMWDNGNEGGYNYDLDNDFGKYDPQSRSVIHPGDIFRGTNTYHYMGYNCCTGTVFQDNMVFFPTEFLHGLYDGGHGAGLQDFWNLMQRKPLSAGGFLWNFADECVERTDKSDRLDCSGNNAPDGILGPYRRKEGSFYAIKDIWSPVQITPGPITSGWDQRLSVENRFSYTNLDQVKFTWELVTYPGPFAKAEHEAVINQGKATSPDVESQSSGYLQLDLPSGWKKADAIKLKATDPQGREIYQWTWPIKGSQRWIHKAVGDTISTTRINQATNRYVLNSGPLTVDIDKKSGYIQQIKKNGATYSLSGGPYLVGDSSSVESIEKDGQKIKARFQNDDYKVTYSLAGEWLKIRYSYRPNGEYPYFGISFDYPKKKVEGIQWLGHGPDRVWKNRLAGAELGLWSKQNKTYPNKITLSGYRWHLPKFRGYYAGLRWATLQTSEGPLTVINSAPNIYLGLLQPDFPPDAGNATAAYPNGNLSFLHAISPIGTKYNHKPKELGPSGQPNMFHYGGFHPPEGKPEFTYDNTLWIYFGEK